MKKHYYLLLIILCSIFTKQSSAQDILFACTFPTTAGNAPSTITSECGMISTATIYADGTNGSDNWTDATSKVFFGGTIPATSLCSVTTATGAFSLVNIGNAYNGKSIVFKLSTTNYENLILNYDTRGTATGFSTHQWLYSTDGTTFTTFTSIGGRTNTTYSSQSVDFSSVTALDNQSAVYIKLVVSGASGTGNNRFDNIKFSATSTVSAPEINIASGSTNYLNNSTYSFGTVVTSTTVVTTFAVQNLGLATLNLTTASFTGGSEYVVNGAPIPATVAAGDVLTFSVEFTPTTAGTFTGVLSITSDDTDENPYIFNVTGVGNVPAPEINIASGSTNYLNNSTYSFGTVVTSTTVVTTFAVQNLGLATLNLTTASFTGGSEYVVNGAPIPATVAVGDVLTFSVEFTPTTAGTFTGVLSITSDDADENPYIFNISGVGQNAAAPEIDVATTTLNFGSIEENTTADLSYTVQNTGTANLVLSTTVSAPYSIVGTPPTTITAGSTATYTVRFSPTATGTFSTNLTIASNDADEPSLNIALTGIATAALPTIFTETFGTPSSTTLIPSYTGWANSGFTFTGTGDVRNTTPSTSYTSASGGGNVFLTTGGTKNIEISNINTSTCSSLTLSFGIHKAQTAANGSDLLVEVSSDGISYSPLSFSTLPTGAGTIGWYYRTASGTIPQAANLRIRFTNTDVSTNQYRIDDVKLRGVCAPAPEINFVVNSTSYVNNSTYSFGTVTVGGTYTVQVGIQNTGTTNLNVSNATSTNTTEFVTNGGTPPPFVVAPGGITTATFSFVPTAAGTYTNVLTLFSDDADESTYTVTFSGVATAPAPEINIASGSTNYLNNSTYSFGTVVTSTTVVTTFAIQNLGLATLNLTTASFTGGSEYVVNGAPIPATVAVGDVLTFSVEFTPTTAGTFTGVLSITSDDADENPYIFNISGVGQNAAAPEIDVATTTLNFGSIEENTTADLTYTVQNTGSANLVLSTTVSAPYSIVGTPPTTITAGSTATYTVRFSPTATGTFSTNLTIASNDADEPSLNIALTGIATAALPTIFTETFGIPSSTTLIPSYTGWANSGFTFTGTGDVRNTTPSTSYTSASGGGNVFLTTGGTKNIEISNINTSTCSSLTLSFGIHKAQTGSDGSELLVEVSSDGISYSPLSFSTLPTGAGTIGWYYRTASGTIPQAGNLRVRFTNTVAATNQYRIDDVKLRGVCAPAPEINFVVNSTSYVNNSTYNFGTVTVGGTYTVQVGIQNTGTTNLNVSNATTTNTTEFVTNGGTPPPFVVAPGGITTATFSFVPTAAGTYTNVLTLFNDDADESTYTVTFSGVATAPAPEINYLINLTTYTNNSTYSFGTVAIGGTYTAQLGVQNTGTANLNVSNATNSNTTEFVTNGGTPPPFVVAPGGVTTATLSFTPTVVGTFTNVLTLFNDDADESTYTVTFIGVAQAAVTPEIDVVTTALNFGSIEENTTADLTYTVQNTGTANLVLSTTVSAPYSIVGTPPTTITAGSTATYTVRFSPTATGTFSTNLTIASNDADEPSLNIALTGVATAGQPVIFTETFGTPSANTPITSYTGWSNAGFTFTGTGDVRSTTPSTSYTSASGGGNVFLTTGGTRNVEISGINTSTCTSMSLSFGVLKSVSGANGSELLVEVSADGLAYTALTFPALPAGTGWNHVTASGTIPQATNLRIRFTNTSTSVQYRVDDVKLKGSCGPATASEINIKEAATSIISGASYDFGTIAPGTKDVVFTIENSGTAALLISTYSITGAEFSLQGSMPTSVAAGSTANFTVRFSSSTPNSYTGSISIANNDADEASYVVNFTATVSNNTTLINEVNNSNTISIFPNPNDGSTLYFTSTTNATIYNSLGAKVIEVKNADKVDISTLNNGVYMINIDKQAKRLIIAK